MTGSPLRVCTFNVHAWIDGQRRSRTEETLALFAALDCDVLILNEVMFPESELRLFADTLEVHAHFAEAAWGGNAVLTKAKPRAVETLPLEAPGRELRSAACVEIEVGAARVLVVGTHLDDRREDARTAQLELVFRFAGARGLPLLVAGDMNALRASDYPPERWADIVAKRAFHHREAPRDDVAALVDRWGWVDAVRRAAGTAPLPPSLAVTCWVGTRVDWVLLDEKAATLFPRGDARVIDTDISDHRPVVVDLFPDPIQVRPLTARTTSGRRRSR